MATVSFILKGNSKPSTIYIRFKHGRKYDFSKSTSLLIDPLYWNNSKGTIKQIAGFSDKKNLQNELNDLKSVILNSFNDNYSNGSIINADWLNQTIKRHFQQDGKTDLNYILDYSTYYKENLTSKVQTVLTPIKQE